jgi:hypothetical protein
VSELPRPPGSQVLAPARFIAANACVIDCVLQRAAPVCRTRDNRQFRCSAGSRRSVPFAVVSACSNRPDRMLGSGRRRSKPLNRFDASKIYNSSARPRTAIQPSLPLPS